MKKTEIAWAAGFFDGEGCITITKTRSGKFKYNHHCLRASIAQVYKGSLDRFQSVIKRGRVRGPYKYGANKQYHWQWNASGMDVLYVLDILWPYLDIPKTVQALHKITEHIEHCKVHYIGRNQFSEKIK
jgi:LAGLIDADG endonuclease